jgi:hypothetical protein
MQQKGRLPHQQQQAATTKDCTHSLDLWLLCETFKRPIYSLWVSQAATERGNEAWIHKNVLLAAAAAAVAAATTLLQRSGVPQTHMYAL